MKISSETFLDQLNVEAKKIIDQADGLKSLPVEKLQTRPNEKSWNVLECLEHMNLYHDYYLPEVKKHIKANRFPAIPNFKAGWLGNYSAKNMLPKKEGKVNMAMKTFRDMDPKGQKLQVEVLDTFLNQMKDLVLVIDQCRHLDLQRTKVKLTIRFMKFTLGDTLHFLINHNRRHMIQIAKILASKSS